MRLKIINSVLLGLFLNGILFAQIEVDSASEIRTEKTIQDIGDVLQIALPAGAGISTILLKDKDGFWQFAKSYSATLLTTYTLKYLINKPRPDGATDGHAFPSGHTSSAFSGASFIQRRFGWEYGVPAYTLAAFVAYSRVEGLHDRHDVWDVLAGAVVGIGSTYIFTTPYLREHYELSFSAQNGNYVLGITYSF